MDEIAGTVMRRADALASFSSMEGGIYRPYGVPSLANAMDTVAGWMRDAGMETRRDAFGNLIGTYAGEVKQPPFVLGGHLDSVRDAGRYDGVLGVLSGIAVVQSLVRDNVRLPFPVQVLAIADEEGARFQALIGSQAWIGAVAAKDLGYRGSDGTPLAEAIREFGGDPEAFPGERPEILGFLEAHIEQGPVLEVEDLPVGVVSSIVASARAGIRVRGMAGHAGTVPMSLRRDALAASAEIVLAVERVATGIDGMVGTVGQLDVSPGASNVVPGATRLSCEVRHPDPDTCKKAIRDIRGAAESICTRRGVTLDWRDSPGYAGTACDPELMRLLGESVVDSGLRMRHLPSGAGHDAVNIAKIAPVAMLFVRCEGGVSHNPAESVMEADVAVAIRVMRGFLERVASES